MNIDIVEVQRSFESSVNGIVSYVGETPFGHGINVESEGSNDTNESEWMVFESEKDAELEALERVRQDLEDEPYIFNTNWLQNYLTIYEADRRVIANEESEAYYGDMRDNDIVEEYKDSYGEVLLENPERVEELRNRLESLEQMIGEETDEEVINGLNEQFEEIDSDLSDEEHDYDIQAMREKLEEDYSEKIYEKLEDPLEYFVHEQGIYSEEDLFKANFISIDIEAAAQDAVDTDGIAHFLDGYDGEVLEVRDPVTDKTFYAYGTN